MKTKNLLFLLALSASALSYGFSTSTYSLVGAYNNVGQGIHPLGDESGTGPLTSASATHSFSGLSSNNVQQTMGIAGTTSNSSGYGALSSTTHMSAQNIYYNAANPLWQGSDGSINEAGSPYGACALGFAFFDDSITFSGSILPGYSARYVFQAQGTNAGVGCLADLAFQVDANPAEAFFSFGDGAQSETWVTQAYAITGAQNIFAQFSNQVVIDFPFYGEGTSQEGTSDYVVTLSSIQILDASGNQVMDVTAIGESGTQYNTVPEPSAIMAVGLGLAGLRARRRTKQA